MNEFAGVLLDLFLIFLLARCAGEVFARFGLPVVIAELLVGVAIGPHSLGLIGLPDPATTRLFGSAAAAQQGIDFVFDVIGQLGLIVLLFYIGLETPFDKLIAVLPRGLAVALPGAAVTMALAVAYMLTAGYPLREALFVGAALAPTSIAVTSRVMQGLGILQSGEGDIILAAAVVDDVVGLLVLALVSELAKQNGFDAREVALIALQAGAFFLFAALVARRLVSRYSLHLDRLKLEYAPLAFALVLMLGFSALAARIGLAGVIGAFLAGIVLSESKERFDLDVQARPIYEFLAPFFFVLTGAHIDLAVFQQAHVIWLALAVTLIAVAGKLIGCSLGAYGRPLRSIAIISVGMVPRGEVGFAVASIGLALGVIQADVFSVIVFMSIATALLAPPALRWLNRDAPPPIPPPSEA